MKGVDGQASPRGWRGLTPLLALAAWGCDPYTSDPGLTATRTVSPASAAPGGSIAIACAFENVGADPVRGFYHAEHLPAAFELLEWSVTIDGAPAGGVAMEISPEGEVLPGRRTYRWIFETPPANGENRPLGRSARIEFTVRTERPGLYDLSWGNWVGARESTGRALFGCWERRRIVAVEAPGDGGAFAPDVEPSFAGTAAGEPAALSERFRLRTGEPRPARARIELSAGTFELSGPSAGQVIGTVAGTVTIPQDRLGGAAGGVAGEIRYAGGGAASLEAQVVVTSVAPSLGAFLSSIGLGDPTGAVAFDLTITARGGEAGGTIALVPGALLGSGSACAADADLVLALEASLYRHRATPGEVVVDTIYTFGDATTRSTAVPFAVGASGMRFLRGDANADGVANIGDAIFVLNFLFSTGPLSACIDACDVNDNGILTIADPAYTLIWMFSGGPEPPPPFPDCGTDPSDDELGCLEYPCPAG